MAHSRDVTKVERFAEFLRRLDLAKSASSFDEAYKQLCEILNGVEDEMTTIPFDPANWRNDGRMYPPQLDNLRHLPGRVDVGRFRSKGHQTLIGENGAIEIRAISGKVLLSKAGSDGKTI